MVSKRLSIKWNPMGISGPTHGKMIIINCTQNFAKGCRGCWGCWAVVGSGGTLPCFHINEPLLFVRNIPHCRFSFIAMYCWTDLDCSFLKFSKVLNQSHCFVNPMRTRTSLRNQIQTKTSDYGKSPLPF